MYNESKYINIDIFKDAATWKSIEQWNSIIESAAKTATFSKTWEYDTNEGGASFWFDPGQVRYTPLPAFYPIVHAVQLDSRFCLITHCANHVALSLINILYRDRKDILIEDICCGMGNLIFYLSRLGFRNFSAIDNWTQAPESLFRGLMERGQIDCTVNDYQAKAVVSTLIAYPHYVKCGEDKKEIIPDSLELFLPYVPLVPGSSHLSMNNTTFFKDRGFTPLCMDPLYRMVWGYCREEKYDEFRNKLEPYRLTN